MPLIKGKAAKTKKGFSTNVKREMDAGKKQSQAVAIAYSLSGEHKMKEHEKKEHHKKEHAAEKEIHHMHKKMHDHHMKEAKHHEKMMAKHHAKKK
jgi:hypothetical protein